MANQFVCAYFKSDKSFSVIPKNRCALRGEFEVGEDVEVTWREPEGNKQAYIGKIVKIAEKKDKKILDKFEEHCVKTMGKRQEEGCTEDVILNDLCQTSLQIFTSKDTENEKEGSGSLGKRKRKTTAIMRESLDQANEQDTTKKKRNDNTGKENVNCNQVANATARQASRRGKGKRQQASAEQSTANNMGQLMFASKYGNKFPSNLTNTAETNSVVSNPLAPTAADPAVPIPPEFSGCSQTNQLAPTAQAYQAVTVPQPPTNSAASPSYQAVPANAVDPSISLANPVVLPTNQVLPLQATNQGLTQCVSAVLSTQQVTPPGSAPPVTYQAAALPYPPVPSTKSVAPRALAQQATLPSVSSTNPAIPSAQSVAPPAPPPQATFSNVTSPNLVPVPSTKPVAPPALTQRAAPRTVSSTNPPFPSAQLVAPPVPARQAIYPAAPNSQASAETSISQTWATCDQALMLSGLREVVTDYSQQDEDIISIDDDLQPQLSPLRRQISPQSTFLSCTQEGDVQKITAENEKLKAENASLKAELATLKEQLEIRPPAPSTEALVFLQSLIQHYNNSDSGDQVQPVTKYTVKANLSPVQSSRKTTVRLLEGRDVFVDRTALRALIQKAHQKGPLFLLKKLLPLVFSTEELAHSCGQGLVIKKGNINQISKPPLDPEKVAVCKEYVTAFYLEREKEGQAGNMKLPTESQINETFTQQVTYARVKLQRAATFSSPLCSSK